MTLVLAQVLLIVLYDSGLSLSGLILDCPAGYVCRISKLKAMDFPATEADFAKCMIPLLTVVWQVKMVLKRSLILVDDDDTIDIPSLNAEANCPVPPCIPSPKIQNAKKRKTPDAGM